MRIGLVVAGSRAGFPTGGASSYLSVLLPELSMSHSVAFLGLDGVSFSDSKLENGPLQASPKFWLRSVRLASLAGLIRWSGHLRRWKPDVLYVHSPELAAGARVLIPRVPIVLHLHGIENPLRFSRFTWARRFQRAYGGIYRFALHAASLVLCSSSDDDIEGLCSMYGIDRCRVRFAAVMYDSSCFSPMPEAMQDPTTRPSILRFVTASRLTSVKRLHLAIRAFSTFHLRHPDTELWIAGDGEERHYLETLARNSAACNAIRFLGDLDRKGVASVMRGAIASLLPSASEGFPLGALESLACGTPVLCSPVGYLHTLVHHGTNGFHVNAESTDSVVAAMEAAFSRYPLFSRACIESARPYSSATVTPVVVAALEDALKS